MREKFLITDLDRTLFDWVEIWYRSFSAMLEVIFERTELDEDLLKSEIRQVHQRHGTSEYAFVLDELPSLQAFRGEEDATVAFADAITAFREARSSALRFYPTVLETLASIRAAGGTIVAYTESMAFYTGYRIRKLGLDDFIEVLFSPEDHDLPKNMTRQEIRRYPSEHYEFKRTQHRHTPAGELKPNPHILQEIMSFVGARREECLYVGGSLYKDIAMAEDAGVDHAWAKYGKAQHRPEYDLLREVTHWTDLDVQREREVLERNVEPSVILENEFERSFPPLTSR